MNWFKRKQPVKKTDTVQRTYEAAQTSRFRKQPTQTQSGDAATGLGGERLRAWARYLDENEPIVTGILNTLVDNICGCGTSVEPMVTNRNGKPNDKLNKEIREVWEQWAERPDVTGELTLAEVERLTCRTWLRDGEALTQLVTGNMQALEHLGGIPFSLELIESDYLPYSLNDADNGVIHGVQKNAWGRPRNYFLYKDHPGNTGVGQIGAGIMFPTIKNTKVVSADKILHLKVTKRFKQTRGVSVLHSVITTIDDYKDFTESERIKARVTASFTAAITKPLEATSPTNDDGDRTFEMSSGMVFDGLMPGEGITSIEATSPTPLMKDFRTLLLRDAAAGTGTSASSISKQYDGTFSSQRQELVESQPAYRRLREQFVSVFVRRIYRTFIDMAVLSGRIKVPASIEQRDLYAADFGTVAMPWIDPMKEAQAIQLLIEMGLESRPAAIRARGKDPRIVDEQIEQDTFEPPMKEAPPMAEDKPEEEPEQDDDEAAA